MSRGKLELFTGPMRGGKTSRMLFEIKKAQDHGAGRALVVKPTTDSRSSQSLVQTYNGECIEAVSVDSADPEKEVWSMLAEKKYDIVAFDEIHFFAISFFSLVDNILHHGYDIYAAGLETDFRGKPFGPTLSLLTLLKHKEYWHRVLPYCNRCKENGIRRVAFVTQRLVNGQPASYFDEVVKPGDIGLYEPRCYECYEPPPDIPNITPF